MKKLFLADLEIMLVENILKTVSADSGLPNKIIYLCNKLKKMSQ